MKTLKLVGVALFALFSFVACDDPTNDQENLSKRLAMVIRSSDMIQFKYDKNGNVIQANEIDYSGRVEAFNYLWDSNKSITLKFNPDFYKYILTDGRITNVFYYFNADKQHNEYTYFNYDNEGHIKDFGGSSEGEIATFNWENSKLLSTGSTSFIYSNQTCNGFFPLLYLFADLWSEEDYLFMAQPELSGIKTNHLPKMIVDGNSYTYTFDYGFDKNNYITSCTMSILDKYNDERNEEIFEFIWE